MTKFTDGDESLEMARSENGDSTSSELERLDNNSPCPSGSDSPTERGIAKTRKKEEKILRIIEETSKLGSNTLDLTNKGMRQFPSEILEMPQLEYLYLEGNELTAVPDEMFDRLPNLKWLDLRRNFLVRLPSVYTGRHQNLRNLLLEGNNLRTLPLELGLIKSLHGLNINNNPLDFPPPVIIEKGTMDILKFLREMIQAKSSGKLLNGRKKAMLRQQSYPPERTTSITHNLASHSKSAGMPSRATSGLRRSAHASIKTHSARMASQQFPLTEEEEEGLMESRDLTPRKEVPNPAPYTSLAEDGSSSSTDDWEEGDGDLRAYAYHQARDRALSTRAERHAQTSAQMAPEHRSAELHRPLSYTSLKQEKQDKIKKAGASGTIPSVVNIEISQKKTRSVVKSKSNEIQAVRKPQSAQSVLQWKVNPYPEPPPPDYISLRAREERQLAKEKEFKEKTDVILQRRKDEELLKNWRMESKRLQQKKYFESLKNGTKDFLDPVEQAPFDIDKDYIKIPTNAERIKQDVKSAHEKIRRVVSPASRQRIEEEKAQRILQLERRIKQHTSSMHERRRAPKGTPQEEMEAAKRELEVVKNLQKDLLRRYSELKQWTAGRVSGKAHGAGVSSKPGSLHAMRAQNS
ncbi:leucine-rich repeat-containing protein 27-like isoform X1 [Mya arenaria]|uniref:leucine-rich repeat-containing protein 27-like isoform X1 n=1 Tax=Mya arenaria TaxID=6604 RepID=UPI0022E9848A|nr:leucine-rich repeat-containing protein 27-like isoform X1 [Mya arenaria]